MGVVLLALLLLAGGMTLVLAHSLWRQLTGRMSDEELLRGTAAGSTE